MKQCPRCYRWHRSPDTTVCERCWEEIGQMQMFDDDEFMPSIDTVFDREEEDRIARGYQ
jgi:hypothetical protein